MLNFISVVLLLAGVFLMGAAFGAWIVRNSASTRNSR